MDLWEKTHVVPGVIPGGGIIEMRPN